MKIMDDLLKPSHPYHKIDTFHGEQSKSMKNVLYAYCGVPKGTARDEVTSNSKKIKPIALAVIELHLSGS